MKNKKFRITAYCLAFLLAALICANILVIFVSEIPRQQIISNILLSVTSLFAIFYILVGCTKERGAKYYHLFMISYAVTMLVLIFINRARAPFSIFFNLIIYGCLCVLATAKDLGRKKSVILASAVLVFGVVTLFFGFGNATMTLFANLCRCLKLMLSATTLFMVMAKYSDKDARKKGGTNQKS